MVARVSDGPSSVTTLATTANTSGEAPFPILRAVPRPSWPVVAAVGAPAVIVVVSPREKSRSVVPPYHEIDGAAKDGFLVVVLGVVAGPLHNQCVAVAIVLERIDHGFADSLGVARRLPDGLDMDRRHRVTVGTRKNIVFLLSHVHHHD